jgi:hypothetical protein
MKENGKLNFLSQDFLNIFAMFSQNKEKFSFFYFDFKAKFDMLKK